MFKNSAEASLYASDELYFKFPELEDPGQDHLQELASKIMKLINIFYRNIEKFSSEDQELILWAFNRLVDGVPLTPINNIDTVDWKGDGNIQVHKRYNKLLRTSTKNGYSYTDLKSKKTRIKFPYMPY